MRFKKIMLITLLLSVILIIGAVSATGETDAIAADETGNETIGDVPVDEDAVEASDDENSVGSEEVDEILKEVNPDDFHVWVTDKTLDEDADEFEVVMNFTSPAGAYGDFDIYVNGEFKHWITLDETTVGQTFNVTLYDLSITEYGTLQISFEFDGGTRVDCGTLTVLEYFDADDFDSFAFDTATNELYPIYSLNGVPSLGTLIVYVDGKKVYTKNIDDEDENLNLLLSDVNITENGKFNIRTEYNVSDNGQLIVVDDFNVTVSCMPGYIVLNDEDIDVSNEYIAPSLGTVYDNTGVIGTVAGYIEGNEVFNKTYTIADLKYEVSLEDFTFYDGFTLGSHMVKIVYLKNNLKQYVNEGMLKFYSTPKIVVPYNLNEGEDKYITVNYYNGTTGTLTVYNAEKDASSSTGWKKGTVFMTENLNGNGTVMVPLKTLTGGDHGFYFDIVLGDNSFKAFVDVSVEVPVNEKPKSSIVIDKNIIFTKGTSVNVTVDVNDAIGFNATIDGHPDAVSINGNVITLSGLEPGTYILSVTTLVDDDHAAVTENATVTVNKISTAITSAAVSAVYKDGKFLVATLKDANGKAISKVKVSTNVKGLAALTTDNYGKVKWAASTLVPGTYYVLLTFAGNADYLKSTQKVTVKVSKATPKLTLKAKTFKKSLKNKKYSVTLKDNKGKAINKAKLTLKVNKVTYRATTNSKGKATFNLKKLTKNGKFTAAVKFAGDKYYKSASKKVKITVKK